MKKILKNKKGFTLVELIVVIAILGVLAVIMVPAFTGYIAKAKVSSESASAKSYCTAYQAAFADVQAGNATDIDAALSALNATYPTLETGKVTIDATTSTGVCTVSTSN